MQVAGALGARVAAVAGASRTGRGRGCAGRVRTRGVVRDGGGADVIVDPVGGEVFDQSLRCLPPEGRPLTVGFASGRIPSAPANRFAVAQRQRGRHGVDRDPPGADPGLFARTAAQLAELVSQGLRPPPAVQFDLADSAAPFRAIEERSVAGKTVLLAGVILKDFTHAQRCNRTDRHR